MAAKKAVVKTAASTRPKRTLKPSTPAVEPAPAAPKPKKAITTTKTTKKAAPKKAAPKKAAPKKTAAAKVTKKNPAAKATKKKPAPKKDPNAEFLEEGTTVPKRFEGVYDNNPLGPAAAKKVADRRAKERATSALYTKMSARYSTRLQDELGEELKAAHARGELLDMSFGGWLNYNVEEDVTAWDEAKKIRPCVIEGLYDIHDATWKEFTKILEDGWEKGELEHCVDVPDYLYWMEAEKITAKKREERMPLVKADAARRAAMKDKKKATVAATRPEPLAEEWVSASSPVKTLQETVINMSPVKQIQSLFGANAEGSQRRGHWSNDSGYRADNEQSSVLSRTWELAAHAVEAMKGAVNSE
ncbi:hypothetical protein D6D01_05055 [Aureobasidium pullulans]|uniref:Uncharacterized protein n=1 Tax=Aureobasidium pullulans TaxID=5580 RepID=A0A4S9L9D8_AURPU|nr:hypothetical protein D6D01_05055 [Aureobasidium pullulans]